MRLSVRGIVSIATSYGWETAFLTMAGVAGLTLLTAVVYWLLEEFRPHSTQASA